MKRYDKYKNSGVEWLGEIPEHWNMLPIRAIFEERNEKNDGPKTDYILSVTKDRGVIPYDEKGAIGNNKSEDIERYKVVYEGDFVINKMNVVIGSLGMSKYFGAFSQVYLVYKPKSSKININYYSYIFSNPSFYKSLIRYCTGIMELRESLNKDDFKKIILPLPDYNIQSIIVNFLDDKTSKIDQAIAIKKKQIELLKERRQILIHKAVTRGLNDNVKLKDSGVEWIGEIPEHWEVKKLKYLALIRYGLGQPPKEKINGLPIIRATNVERGNIVEKGLIYVDPDDVPWDRNPTLKENEIIVVRSGAYTGDSAIITKKYANSIAGYDMVMTPVNVNACFLSYVMLSSYVLYEQLYLLRMRAAQPHLNAEELGNTLIIVSPANEQTKIAEYIELGSTKIATAISLKEQEIEKLKEYKMSLIDGVVTGKIKVC